MIKNICTFCTNKDCSSSKTKYDVPDITECSAYEGKKLIDWEQRRYEIAKDVYAALFTQTITSAYSREELAVQFADSLIKQLKENN